MTCDTKKLEKLLQKKGKSMGAGNGEQIQIQTDGIKIQYAATPPRILKKNRDLLL
jgi:hypothetical protein